MNKVNGYRNFSFGDIIKFTDKDIDKRFKNKEFKFIKVDGEDYLLYDVKEKDTITIRAYYFNKFVKVKEEQKKITTWELSYEDDK
jgi:hypothetical protein